MDACTRNEGWRQERNRAIQKNFYLCPTKAEKLLPLSGKGRTNSVHVQVSRQPGVKSMRHWRPTSVLVIAILNMVFAVLGLIWGVGGLAWQELALYWESGR